MTSYFEAWQTLGRVAHRGGPLITDPVLSVGVVHAVARVSGLQLELVARRPVDHRSALQRQADIRNRVGVTPAPRVLLPPHDEGTGLRLGWSEGPGGPVRWEHPIAYHGGSGDPAAKTGPSVMLTYFLPPLFDHVELVFAWPEIGFHEQTVSLRLPSQFAVEDASMSVWEVPPATLQAPTWTERSTASLRAEMVRPEEGTVLTAPGVLWRSDDAIVVLRRLSRYDRVWQLELFGHISGSRADIASQAARATPAHKAFAGGDLNAPYGGLVAGIVDGHTVHWDTLPSGQSSGGLDAYDVTRISTLSVPHDSDGTARLALRWPAAGLLDAEVKVPIAH